MERLLTLYSEVQSTDVRWLWYPFIPYGKLTIIQGDPGDGKTTLVLNLAAKLSKGIGLDEDMQVSEPMNIIYQTAEDGLADTVKPRLEAADADCEKIMVVANLPYYITTPILTHLIENTKRIDGYVVMMQREVANRLNAKVGTKDYNSLTILLNYYTNVEYLFTVPKKVFVPAPNVESAVVKIMTKDKKEFEADSKFFKFVRSCFVQRRKTLLNNLISSYGKDKKQDLQNSCLDSEIDSTRRSETLSLREFYNLYNNLKNNDLI